MPRSKKSKKTADNASPAQVGGQEVSSEEAVPPTIVEATEGEVFPIQAEGQEVVAEQPTPVKPKASKRPYIALVESHLETGDMDKKALLALIMENYPDVNRNGASTFLTDALNPKYSHWKDRVVTKTPEGKLIFADRLEAPGPEVVPEAEPTEKPAE